MEVVHLKPWPERAGGFDSHVFRLFPRTRELPPHLPALPAAARSNRLTSLGVDPIGNVPHRGRASPGPTRQAFHFPMAASRVVAEPKSQSAKWLSPEISRSA